MTQVREQLTQPGKTLELDDVGLGALKLGDGVRPKLVTLAPLAGANAWQIEWQCEFCLRAGELTRVGDLWLALNYTTTYTIDDRGFTTRTLRGYAQVLPVTAGTPGTRPHTADEVRDQLRFITPAGFRRTASQWQVSADGGRVDFEVVDMQLQDEPYPPGIVAAELEYSVEHAPGGPRVAAALVGWMETAADASPALAAVRFLEIAHDKVRRLAHSPGAKPGLVVPSRFAVRRQLFTRRTHFTLELHVVRRVRDLLAATGVWESLPQSDERLWRASLARLWSNRAVAGFQLDARENVVIDLVDRPTRAATLGRGHARRFEVPAPLPTLLWSPVITEATSWLEYQVRLRAEREENITTHTLARAVRVSRGGGESPLGVGQPFRTVDGGVGEAVETHGPPLQTITFEGQALRVRYLPITPAATSVGGRPVRELRRMEEREVITHFGDEPVHGLRWSIVYRVEGYMRSSEWEAEHVRNDK